MAKVPTAATQAADQTASPPTRLHGLVQTRRSPLSRPRVTVRTRAHVEALDAGDGPWRHGVRTIGTEQTPAHACYHRGVTPTWSVGHWQIRLRVTPPEHLDFRIKRGNEKKRAFSSRSLQGHKTPSCSSPTGFIRSSQASWPLRPFAFRFPHYTLIYIHI
ncbi:hypothetical protein M513_05135 [Trichuris suis]|uniref:Uncharacterized protein n=1 Tax=Trichuris suis TaxID=68888 RepID=A0A085M9H2_9BILA|nr:hypothetical protein M513_05135 [Trichuris suis]